MTGRRTTAFLATRGLRAALVAGTALGLLLLLVGWVEAGARSGGGVMDALVGALLEVPGHLVRGSPLVAALAAALAAAGLVRAGEWQALGAAGSSPAARLAPLALVGLLVGTGAALVQDTLVPIAAIERARRESAGSGGPLVRGGEAWLTAGEAVLRVTPAGPGVLGPSTAWRRLPGPALERLDVGQLAWNGRTWAPPGGPAAAPWSDLPPPDTLAVLLVPGDPADRPWASLRRDRRLDARAEVQARWSRPVSCVPAALTGAALPITLGATSPAVVLGVLPVVAWEVVALALQSVAGQGALSPAWVAIVRLLLAGIVTGLALRPSRRPGSGG